MFVDFTQEKGFVAIGDQLLLPIGLNRLLRTNCYVIKNKTKQKQKQTKTKQKPHDLQKKKSDEVFSNIIINNFD